MKEKFTSNKVFLATPDMRIQKVAQKVGIRLPSVHTALFQTVYAAIETPNLNGVRLEKSAVEKGLHTLIGAQANLNHSADMAPEGKGFLVGIILDAWVDAATQEINVIFSFAKQVYQEAYLEALDEMQAGTLSVSFELMSSRETQERLEDGTVRLHDIEFTGVGLLLGKPPAYPKAKVYEMANDYRNRAIQYGKDLVYAEKIIESCDKILADDMPQLTLDKPAPEMKCTCPHCNSPMDYTDMLFDADYNMYHKPCITMGSFRKPWFMKAEDINKVLEYKNKSEGDKLMTEEQKKLVAEIRQELAGYIPQDVTDEQLLDEAKVAEFRSTKVAAEKAEADKAQAEKEATDKAEAEKAEAEKVAAEKAEADKKATEEAEAKAKEEATSKISALETKVSELQTIVDAQKKELDAFKLAEETRKAEEKANKIAEVKSTLQDNPYTKDFTDEDYLNVEKVQVAKDRKERDDLKSENDALKKNAPHKAEKEVKITTGHKDENSQKQDNPRNLIKNIGKRSK